MGRTFRNTSWKSFFIYGESTWIDWWTYFNPAFAAIRQISVNDELGGTIGFEIGSGDAGGIIGRQYAALVDQNLLKRQYSRGAKRAELLRFSDRFAWRGRTSCWLCCARLAPYWRIVLSSPAKSRPCSGSPIRHSKPVRYRHRLDHRSMFSRKYPLTIAMDNEKDRSVTGHGDGRGQCQDEEQFRGHFERCPKKPEFFYSIVLMHYSFFFWIQ